MGARRGLRLTRFGADVSSKVRERFGREKHTDEIYSMGSNRSEELPLSTQHGDGFLERIRAADETESIALAQNRIRVGHDDRIPSTHA